MWLYTEAINLYNTKFVFHLLVKIIYKIMGCGMHTEYDNCYITNYQCLFCIHNNIITCNVIKHCNIYRH